MSLITTLQTLKINETSKLKYYLVVNTPENLGTGICTFNQEIDERTFLEIQKEGELTHKVIVPVNDCKDSCFTIFCSSLYEQQIICNKYKIPFFNFTP